MRRILLVFLLVLVCFAASTRAAEPFIALVDEERGLLLIPEGTAIPIGVEFQLTPDAAEPRSLLSLNAVAGEDPAPRRFVYAYAAPERFAEARRRIAAAAAKFPHPEAEVVRDGERKAVGMRAGVERRGRVAANIADFDQTYYYYFWDGSFHAMRKIIQNNPNGWVYYTGYGYAYSEAGDWDTKVYVNNTSPTVGYSAWSQNKTCWFYNASGTCTPAIWWYGNRQPFTPTATVNSSATLTRYLYPPCDLPCKSNSSSTMSISFP